MRRTLIVPLVALALGLAACTSNGSPVGGTASPAAVDIGGGGGGGGGGGQGSIVGVVQKVLPAVVNVTSRSTRTDPFGQSQTGKGVGTGFLVSSDGYLVTNWHVVENAQQLIVTTSGDHPKEYAGRVVGGDPLADLAVVKVDATGLPTVPLGSSSGLQLGQRVVAIGYALALEGGPSVTTGIVSAENRVITAPDPSCQTCQGGSRTYHGAIQTDAAINPGNSGGPLVNLAGQVVGINTAGSSSAENIGFAIAIDTAKPIIQHAIDNPGAPVPFLGVGTQSVTPSIRLQLNLGTGTGAVVLDTVPGGPADDAGIRQGDVIVSFAGKDVTGSDQLRSLILSQSPGDSISMTVIQPGGARNTVSVTLGTNPAPLPAT